MNQSTWNKIKKWAQILTVIFLVACVYSILKMASANTNARSGNAGFMIGYLLGSNPLIPLSFLSAVICWFVILVVKPNPNKTTFDHDLIVDAPINKNPLTQDQKNRLEYLLAKTASDDTLTDEEFQELQTLSE